MSGDQVTAGEGVGRPGAGGRECPGRAPLQGTGETEAQSPGRGWALQPQLAQLGAVLAVRLSSASPTLSLCACRSLPLSAGVLCLCVSQAVCPCPSASFVPLYVSDIYPFVRPTVFVRPKPLNICHCLSLRFRVSLPARVCLPVRSVSLSVPCPCFSVWLRPDSWALFQ